LKRRITPEDWERIRAFRVIKELEKMRRREEAAEQTIKVQPFKVEPSMAKVIVSGNIVEIYEYENPVWLRAKKGGRMTDGEKEKMKEAGIENGRDMKNRKFGTRKARNMLRRLALSNFDERSKFLTLTFADGSIKDITNIDLTNKEFKKFVQRLRRRFGDFKYIAVIEFQDKNGRGAVHYHMMSDLPYIKKDELRELWGQGFVRINDIRHVDNVGAYMVKYMLKDINDERLLGKKSYLTSKNLIRPIELHSYEAYEIIQSMKDKQKKETYADTYESEYCGQIIYKEYNMKRS
jgi:hypothetical protein